MRGLNSDQVLILVDGKRWHSSALMLTLGQVGRGSQGVNIGTIPIGAIERIEVLRDGASAQYGSDALAGVINIILQKGQRSEARREGKECIRQWRCRGRPGYKKK